VLGQIQPYGSVSQELINHGYEKDRSWERELEDVVPDLSESHPSIKPTEKYIRFKRRFNTLRAMRVWFYHSGAVLLSGNSQIPDRYLGVNVDASPAGIFVDSF
jgi:hypothetical protein